MELSKTEVCRWAFGKNRLHLISKLRKDADLTYLYTGEISIGKGRRKQYDGKMNCSRLRKNVLNLLY